MGLKVGRFVLEQDDEGLVLRARRPSGWTVATVAAVGLLGFGPVLIAVYPQAVVDGGQQVLVPVVVGWLLGIVLWPYAAYHHDTVRAERGLVTHVGRRLELVGPQAGGDYRERSAALQILLDGKRLDPAAVHDLQLRRRVD